jgi:YfiH family protein
MGRTIHLPDSQTNGLIPQMTLADQPQAPVIVRIPEWEKYKWLRHGFSTRPNGTSRVYGGSTLNLGWTKEDAPAAVAENRRQFVQAINGEHGPSALVTLRQIHSATVRRVKEEDGALEGKLQTAEGKAVLEGDGLITGQPGVLLAVGTADCVPVLVVDIEKRVAAAFHAGWRGTAVQIVEQGIATMQEEYGTRVEDLMAATGPSIGPCCYTIGEEVRNAFSQRFRYADCLFNQREGRAYLNLWEANRQQLLHAGLTNRQIALVGECTACKRDEAGELRYFSHREQHGVAGRMLNVIGILR